MLLELLKVSKLFGYGLSQFSSRFTLIAWWTELREIEVVIENLSCIVEHSAFGRCHDDVFESPSLPLWSFKRRVEIVDIGLQVLSVMKLKGLLADDRFELVSSIWQSHELELPIDG